MEAPLVVALGDEPSPHGLRVRHHAVAQTTEPALRPPLCGTQVVAGVADGGDDHGHSDQPRQRGDEHVGVKAVGVDDADAVPTEVSPETHELGQGTRVAQAGQRVVGQRDSGFGDVRQELPLPPEAGEVEVETRAVEGGHEAHDLALGPSDPEGGHEFQEPDLQAAASGGAPASASHTAWAAIASPAI
jgi:hypothetical protein